MVHNPQIERAAFHNKVEVLSAMSLLLMNVL